MPMPVLRNVPMLRNASAEENSLLDLEDRPIPFTPRFHYSVNTFRR